MKWIEEEHRCVWYDEMVTLQERLARVEEQVQALLKEKFGKRSEKGKPAKMPPAVPAKPASPQERAAQRQERAQLREDHIEAETIPLPVPDEKRTCPHCKNDELRALGEGVPSTIYDYVPGYFRKKIYLRETLHCSCKSYTVTAEPPERVDEKVHYSSPFIAHIVVSKCLDAMPLYRMEKQFERLGIPMARSTMCTLFHRAARLLRPIWIGCNSHPDIDIRAFL